MSRLIDRMQHVLDHHGWSKRQWSINAGLSELSHVSSLMRIMQKTGRDLVGDLNTWAKLAEAAGTSLDWLVYGRGKPWPLKEFRVKKDRYASRGVILATAHLCGISAETVEAVGALTLDGLNDPGASFWMLQIITFETLREQRLGRPPSVPPQTG